MFIKSDLYIQKTFRTIIAIYVTFNVGQLFKFYFVKYKILSCTKTI